MYTGAVVKTINMPEDHFYFIMRVLHDTVNIPEGEINDVLDELFTRQETALALAQRANSRHASRQPDHATIPTSSPESRVDVRHQDATLLPGIRLPSGCIGPLR